MTPDDLIHYYHLGVDFVARISLCSPKELDFLRSKFLVEAARMQPDTDRTALQCLANICENFKNEG